MTSLSIAEALQQLQELTPKFAAAQTGRSAPITSNDVQSQVDAEVSRLAAVLRQDCGDHAFPAPGQKTGEDALSAVASIRQTLQNLANSSNEGLNVIVREVLATLTLQEPSVRDGLIRVELLSKAIGHYVESPVQSILKQANSASSEVLLAELRARQEFLEGQLVEALKGATSRRDKQAVRAAHGSDKESFFGGSLAKLGSAISMDLDLQDTLQLSDIAMLTDASRDLSSLLEKVTAARKKVRGRKLPYSTQPAVLAETKARLQAEIDANSEELGLALSKAVVLMQTHLTLCQELSSTSAAQVARSEAETKLESERASILQKLDADVTALQASKAALSSLQAEMEAHVASLRKVCSEQSERLQARLAGNSEMFASLFQQYWRQLQDLKDGKEKCLRTLDGEIKLCEKEITRWEALEHEVSGAQHLEELDAKLVGLRGQHRTLEQECASAAQKLSDLEKTAEKVLSRCPVPGFVHPREAHQRQRVEQLQKRQVELSQMLSTASGVGSVAGSVMGDREDLGCLDDDFGEQVAMEPGALLLGSPFLLQRQLHRVNKELQSIPFSVTPEKKPVDASAAFSTPKRVVDEKLRVPTPKQLAEDRALKQGKTVRRPDALSEETGPKIAKKRKFKHPKEGQ